eukprot:1817412-Pleurochrysis_carterae.AAC.2
MFLGCNSRTRAACGAAVFATDGAQPCRVLLAKLSRVHSPCAAVRCLWLVYVFNARHALACEKDLWHLSSRWKHFVHVDRTDQYACCEVAVRTVALNSVRLLPPPQHPRVLLAANPWVLCRSDLRAPQRSSAALLFDIRDH